LNLFSIVIMNIQTLVI